MKIALCIPTFITKLVINIVKLLWEIDELFVNNGATLGVFVLDDNSPDGTAKIALDTQTGLKTARPDYFR